MVSLKDTCSRLMTDAARAEAGLAVKGRAEKAAARDLVRRGLASLNEPETRMMLTPAGRWVLAQSK